MTYEQGSLQLIELGKSQLIVVFAFSSILGNYTYAEVNMDFLGGGKAGDYAMRALVVVATFWGAIQELGVVWSVADVAMSVMAVINISAMFMLSRYAVGALRDFDRQGGSPESVFDLLGNPDVPDDVPGEVWHSEKAKGLAGSPH